METSLGKGKSPGSIPAKICAWFWYGPVIGVYLYVKQMMLELFTSVDKYNYDELPKRTGDVAVLTGGARGIGLEVLKKLLTLDFTVIMGVRQVAFAEQVIADIRDNGIKSGRVKCFKLDLMSLESVRQFGDKVVENTDRIDVLINNAGIMFASYEQSADGYESHFQVNHLSHFLLTQMLLEKITKTGNEKKIACRIVNVSSLANFGSKPSRIPDCAKPKLYTKFGAYYDSKLCQVLETKRLASQLQSEGANVKVFSLHPGIIPTGLWTGVFAIMGRLFKRIYRTVDDGSEVIMYTIISFELEDKNGEYIVNRKCYTPNNAAEDVNLQEKVWNLSQDCLKEAGIIFPNL